MVVEEPNVPGAMHTEPAVTSSGRGLQTPDSITQMTRVVIAALHENPRKQILRCTLMAPNWRPEFSQQIELDVKDKKSTSV